MGRPCEAGTEIVPVGPSAVVAGGPRLSLLESFLESMSPQTRRAYDADLRAFGRFAGSTSHVAVGWLLSLDGGPANEIVLRYRTAMTESKLSPATIGRRLAAVRSVVRMARMLGVVSWSIEVSDPKVQKYRDTRGPGLSGWRAMRSTAEAMADGGLPLRNVHPHQGARDLALVQLLRGLALRRSSAVRLDLADVELEGDDPCVHIFEKGKAQKVRRSLSAGPAESLRAWIALRGDWPGPLFHRLDRAAGASTPARLDGSSVWRIVRALGHRAGLTRQVRPHGLRHEAITAAIEKGASLPDVQVFAGHADPRTTMLYYDRTRNAAGQVAKLIDGE